MFAACGQSGMREGHRCGLERVVTSTVSDLQDWTLGIVEEGGVRDQRPVNFSWRFANQCDSAKSESQIELKALRAIRGRVGDSLVHSNPSRIDGRPNLTSATLVDQQL